MPVRHEIDKSGRLIVHTAEGDVSFSEIKQDRENMRRDPGFDPSFNMLWDATAVTKMQLSSDELVFFAQNRILSKASRVAFVAPEAHVFGVLRMFEIHYSLIDDSAQSQVFRKRAEALEWLNRKRSA